MKNWPRHKVAPCVREYVKIVGELVNKSAMSAEEPKSTVTAPPTPPVPSSPPIYKRRPFIIASVLIVAAIFGIPAILHALHTASTDDAYVNSYVTFVAPRVPGQVARVLVDDNNRVKKGDVLVELDPEP